MMKLATLVLMLALAACSSENAVAPQQQLSCSGLPLPTLFHPVLFDGSVGSATLNHFVTPARTADTVNVSWVPEGGGGVLQIKLFGRCETLLDSLLVHDYRVVSYRAGQ